MEETIESLYPRIGQAIADAITEEWSSASIWVEFKPGAITLQGKYVPERGEQQKSIRISRTIVGLLRELHARMKAEMGDDWQTAKFELARDGQFSMKFEYGE